MNQIDTMMTMIATNCSTTRSRISFCDVLGEPPRNMLVRPRTSTRATAPTAIGTAYKARKLDMDILLALGGGSRYHGGTILQAVPPCGDAAMPEKPSRLLRPRTLAPPALGTNQPTTKPLPPP